MKKNDFTNEFVTKKLQPYLQNHDYPHDEMLDIGGTHARMTGLSDLEVKSVTQSGSSFNVEGTAHLDATIELGEGDAPIHRSLPMTFTYEFDEDGKVIRRSTA